MQIDTSSRANASDSGDNVTAFTKEEVIEATKSSNFNKGLGPDCFDGNLMRNNKTLNDKMITEITNAMNSAYIPEYLRVGRLVPL